MIHIWCTYKIYVHTLYIPILVWYIPITYKSIPSIYTLISCGKQRLGGLSCEETAVRKDAALQERDQRGAETRWRCKADQTWLEVKCGYDASTFQHVHCTCMVCSCTYLYIECTCIVYTCIYVYIPCQTLYAEFSRMWMQDTADRAWVMYTAMLHQ